MWIKLFIILYKKYTVIYLNYLIHCSMGNFKKYLNIFLLTLIFYSIVMNFYARLVITYFICKMQVSVALSNNSIKIIISHNLRIMTI